MKTLYVMLAASLALAFVPHASAATCDEVAPREGFAHPTQKDRYIFIVAADGSVDLEKFGEWTEGNGRNGLQTSKCFEHGVSWYKADKRAALLA